MSDAPRGLIAVSDVLGLGKLADSKAAERLVDALTKGLGRVVGPWLLRREFNTQVQLLKLAEDTLGIKPDAEIQLADRSSLQLRFRALCEQQNRESIAQKALERFADEAEVGLLNDACVEYDWLEQFWRYAETVSNEKLQEIWGRVLARETTTPGSISLRTLQALRSLSYEEALEIQRLASFTVATFHDDGELDIFSTGFLNSLYPKAFLASANALSDREISKQLTKATETDFRAAFATLGFWELDGWGREFFHDDRGGKVRVRIGNEKFSFSGFRSREEEFRPYGGGRGISLIAYEVFSLANMPADESYVRSLSGAFEKLGGRVERGW